MTLMRLIFTDKIRYYPLDPCYPCSITYYG